MRCLSCWGDGLEAATLICPVCKQDQAILRQQYLVDGTLLRNSTVRVEYPLGRGGLAVTYRALHVQLNQPVAVKEFFPTDLAARGAHGEVVPQVTVDAMFHRLRHQFVREGQTLALIRHPNVVRVTDSFEERGTAYLVMDLLDGPTLRAELTARGGCLPEPEVRHIIGELAAGLSAVHAHGIYHLDIKPSNVVMVTDSSDNALHPVLIDFGAARQPSNTTGETQVQYTPAYAPLELVRQQAVGPQSDVFELGMLAHELLTGQKPPNAVEREPDDSWEPSASLDGQWPGLLKWALELDCERRPSTIDEWWHNPGPTVSPPTILAPHRRTIPRRAAILGMTSAGVSPWLRWIESRLGGGHGNLSHCRT